MNQMCTNQSVESLNPKLVPGCLDGGKKVYFEFMRVIACGLVIFNHLPGYSLYMRSRGYKQFFYMCITMITRINVPLFFMISGALLFCKSEDYILVLKKRVFRVIGLLFIFDLILIGIQKYLSISNGTEFSITLKDFLIGVLNGQSAGSGSYWYLYSYLGVLFVLPFMQRIAKELTRKEIITLFILHFVKASLIPMINIFSVYHGIEIGVSLSGYFSVPFAFEKPFFYTLIGYYLEYNVDCKKIKTPHLGALFFVGIMGIVLSNICTYMDAEINGAYSQDYVQLFDYIITIVVFILIKYLFTMIWQDINILNFEKIICFLGSMTLGIYMLDSCFKPLFYAKWDTWAEPLFPTMIVSIGWILISMTAGTLCMWMLKKIPMFKTLL